MPRRKFPPASNPQVDGWSEELSLKWGPKRTVMANLEVQTVKEAKTVLKNVGEWAIYQGNTFRQTYEGQLILRSLQIFSDELARRQKPVKPGASKCGRTRAPAATKT